MQYNECLTCGANEGRAGILIDRECLNCCSTRRTGIITIDSSLPRTEEEIGKTMAIVILPN